jgi:hypothetical protein
MYIVRTYFLFCIVNGKEIRYSVYSSVTSCLEMFATSFARPAHIASESYETRSKADVDRASGDSVTVYLQSRPSRLASRVLATGIILWREKRAGNASFALPDGSRLFPSLVQVLPVVVPPSSAMLVLCR